MTVSKLWRKTSDTNVKPDSDRLVFFLILKRKPPLPRNLVKWLSAIHLPIEPLPFWSQKFKPCQKPQNL
jgi:hypothetical protein